MNIAVLRQQLLSNITQMCDYAKNELFGTSREFNYKYEHGFIYGYSSYYIAFSYWPSSNVAEVSINFYRGHEYFFRDNKVFDGHDSEPKDITQSFLTNFQWYSAKEIQQAMEITQRKWPEIKCAIQRAKVEEQEIMNFHI